MTGEPLFKHTPLEAEARITRLERRIAELEAALQPLAELTWQEDYIGVETPNARVFVSRRAILRARALLAEGETDER